jgi:class 3 adenylate cyclase
VETNSATATFLFTDIEGSTQLLKTHRAEYARILADHHSILREQLAAHSGKEIDNQGGRPDRLPGRGERVALTARQTPASVDYRAGM